jgi:stage IV sporulation protein FB
MDDTTIIEAYTFPDKPKIAKENSSLTKSVGSLILFIAAFYLFFNKDISYIFILVIVLLIHELGHFIAMKYYNYKDVKMFFIPLLGALVTGDKHEISQKQRAIILLAGPLPGIIIGLILYYIGYEDNQHILIVAANMFIFLNMFNLLPLKPLDGGNLIGILFFDKKETIQAIFVIISACGLILLALLLESYIFLIVPVFLLSGILQKFTTKKIKADLERENIDYNKPFEELTNAEYWTIRKHVVIHVTSFNKISPTEFLESKHEKQIIDLIKSLFVKAPIFDLSGKTKTMFLLIWILFMTGPFIALALIIR